MVSYEDKYSKCEHGEKVNGSQGTDKKMESCDQKQ